MTTDFLSEGLDVLMVLPYGLYDIFDSLSIEWDVASVFSDADMASPIIVDKDYSSSTAFEPGTGLISGETISRNTAIFVAGALLVVTLTYFGFRKASILMGVLYQKMFGVKARISKLDDKVDGITDMLQSMILSGQGEGVRASSEDIQAIRTLLDNALSMLGNADIEITSLVTALLNNRKSFAESVAWDKDNITLVE